MSFPVQVEAKDLSVISNAICMAFTNKGNPCRNRRKNLTVNFCGVHCNSYERTQLLQSGMQEAKIALQANVVGGLLQTDLIHSDLIHSDNNELGSNNSSNSNPINNNNMPIFRPQLCNQFTARGLRCKHTAIIGLDGMCTRHYNLSVRPQVPLRNSNPVSAIRQRIEEIKENMDDEKLIDELVEADEIEFQQMMVNIAHLSVQEHEYKHSNSNPIQNQLNLNSNTRRRARAGAGAMGYKTNMKTLRECECDICAEDKKRMIMLHCCRKEMCADCMGKITNAKCPFCKQDNTMLID